MLDELHNFFPEMLYDDALFGSEPFRWARHRLSALFPAVFVRQQNMYTMYNSSQRAAMFNQWRIGTGSSFPAPLQPIPVPITTYWSSEADNAALGDFLAYVAGQPAQQTQQTQQTQPAQQTQQTQQTQQAPQTPPRRTTPVNQVPQRRPPVPIHLPAIASQVNDALRVLAQIDYSYFDTLTDVPVIPTSYQIANGSHLVNSVPEDTQCAICQDNGVTGQWRRLSCSHYFHNGCILPWFQAGNVRCPVCRHDIRDSGQITD